MVSKSLEPLIEETENFSDGVFSPNSMRQWVQKENETSDEVAVSQADQEQLTKAFVAYYIQHVFPTEGLAELLKTMNEIAAFHKKRAEYIEEKEVEKVYKPILIQKQVTRPSFNIYDEE